VHRKTIDGFASSLNLHLVMLA